MSTRDDYIAKMKTQLDAWNAEIDALEDKASDVRVDVKVKYDGCGSFVTTRSDWETTG
jgi:hypothetical protein